MHSTRSRRQFLRTSAAPNGNLRVPPIGVVGTIGTIGSIGRRARQSFVLYGSAAATDPGWNVQDASQFTPIIDLVARETDEFDCAATSIRQSAGKPLGRYRWLVWAVTPVTYDGGSNTSIAELQVLSANAP